MLCCCCLKSLGFATMLCKSRAFKPDLCPPTPSTRYIQCHLTLIQEPVHDADEDRAELGMAANSILQSIPPHMLKALEQQQVEANAVNAESKVYHPCGQTPFVFLAVFVSRLKWLYIHSVGLPITLQA